MLAEKCTSEKLFAPGPVVLSAGGSDFFDLVLKELKGPRGGLDTILVIRSGCYLTHDSLNYREAFERVRGRTPEAGVISPGLQPALQVWGVVQSLPEPGLAIVKALFSLSVDFPS